MFESLTDKLELTFKRLRGQGKISETNIDDALRDVRLALLEADVHVQVVKSFLEAVKSKSMGQEVLRSLTPEQQFIKIVRATRWSSCSAANIASSISKPRRRW
jgi:signal recognition particle subunit SRP54